MFLDNSRYARIPVVDVPGPDGTRVKAVMLRRLPATAGSAEAVTRNDRLDLVAHRRYGEPTWFWHIADANSELEAQVLVSGRYAVILVPQA